MDQYLVEADPPDPLPADPQALSKFYRGLHPAVYGWNTRLVGVVLTVDTFYCVDLST